MSDTPPHILSITERYPRAYLPWEDDDDTQLQTLLQEGHSLQEISTLLARQPGAVHTRLRTLGLTPPVPTRKAPEAPRAAPAPSAPMPLQLEETRLELNSNQEHIAGLREGVQAIVAGSGSGKTRTLSARVLSLLREGYEPQRLALISASDSLRREVLGAIGREHRSSFAHVGGLESFARNLLRPHLKPRDLRHLNAPEILNEAEAALRYGSLTLPAALILDDLQEATALELSFVGTLLAQVDSALIAADPQAAVAPAALMHLLQRSGIERHYLPLSYRLPEALLEYAQSLYPDSLTQSPLKRGGRLERQTYGTLEEALEAIRQASQNSDPDTLALLVPHAYRVTTLKNALALSHIMSIHEAKRKGLEWPFVIMLEDAPLPPAERTRLRYLAVTRASERVLMLEAEVPEG